jgi:hypothetical protein
VGNSKSKNRTMISHPMPRTQPPNHPAPRPGGGVPGAVIRA